MNDKNPKLPIDPKTGKAYDVHEYHALVSAHQTEQQRIRDLPRIDPRTARPFASVAHYAGYEHGERTLDVWNLWHHLETRSRRRG